MKEVNMDQKEAYLQSRIESLENENELNWKERLKVEKSLQQYKDIFWFLIGQCTLLLAIIFRLLEWI